MSEAYLLWTACGTCAPYPHTKEMTTGREISGAQPQWLLILFAYHVLFATIHMNRILLLTASNLSHPLFLSTVNNHNQVDQTYDSSNIPVLQTLKHEPL